MTFRYIPRTTTQIDRRAHQSFAGDWKMALTAKREAQPSTIMASVAPESAVSVEPKPDGITAAELIGQITKAKGVLKVSASGHLTLTGERIPEELFTAMQARQDEIVTLLKSKKKIKTAAVSPVPSEGFVETRSAYLCCVTCSHMRCQHCTRRKLRLGQVLTDANWKGFVDDDGQIQPCQHTPETPVPYACDSTSCIVRLGSGADEHYCSCKKWKSPRAQKRTAKPRTEPANEFECKTLIPLADLERAHANYLAEKQGAPKSKTKEEILIEVFREDSTLTSAQLSEASGRSQAWVRKHLRAAGLIPPSKSRGKAVPFTTGVNP
jgi:hypothetical protein